MGGGERQVERERERGGRRKGREIEGKRKEVTA